MRFSLAVTGGLLLVCLPLVNYRVLADDAPSSSPVLHVPPGFSIERIAGPPLVERPVAAAFDDEGHLYVAESSGSNDPVEKQLELRPHRIIRLTDTDGDGKFDQRTVFADRMMFPSGAMFLDGSLYVSAPPSIWKLTDKDGDGVADERIEWFKGKTLTTCANDLHGPYAGPDGFIYWCKGAFAEQTHMVKGREWKTTAAHIFRCRPDGSDFEPVMTGGMDNPVDVAFMPDGERILSGTFFAVNPRHDGLIHAVYGGVYGKDHGVLEGHVRTGDLLPILDPLSAAAACGLERYDSDVFGPEYRDNLFLCQFNLRKVSRHILKSAGSTFSSEDSDFVTSDFVDFHPTDVLADADGSLVIIDTGGWYKLCCPTSQLWKPDVTGGIYRVRRIGAKVPDDPRGRAITWATQSPAQLWSLIADPRPAVRERAKRTFVKCGNDVTQDFLHSLAEQSPARVFWEDNGQADDAKHSPSAACTAIARAWALSQIDTTLSRSLVRLLLDDHVLRHVALESESLHANADDETAARIAHILVTADSASDRRVAAEAIGRIGNRRFVPELLRAAAKAEDRIEQHSIIYALIELGDPTATRPGLTDKSPKTIAAALIALDQMPHGGINADDIIPHLRSTDETLRQAAGWIVRQHPQWGGELAQWFGEQLKSVPPATASADAKDGASLADLLVLFSSSPDVQSLIADACLRSDSSATSRAIAIRAIANSKLTTPPKSWVAAIAHAIANADAAQLPTAIAAARRFQEASASDPTLSQALVGIVENDKHPLEQRVDSLAIIVDKQPKLNEPHFKLLLDSLSSDNSVAVRSAAADAISNSHLDLPQLKRLTYTIQSASPLELNRLLKPYEDASNETLGLGLIASLKKSPSLAALRLDLLREALAKYDPAVHHAIDELESQVNVDAGAQREEIEKLLPLVAKGDVRRGQQVFYSSKASCSSCHRLGYAGGTTGPELSHVGQTRSDRDILESILFPSLSFVRSYEPMMITLQDGKTLNGIIRDQNSQEYVVATGPDQFVHIQRADIDEIQPSKVSIMPAGFDKQLTPQELADVVAFLRSTKGN